MAVLQWSGALSPDVFNMYADPTSGESVSDATSCTLGQAPRHGVALCIVEASNARLQCSTLITVCASVDGIRDADTCEHVVFGDIAWGVPVAFARSPDVVISLSIPNWDGAWSKA